MAQSLRFGVSLGVAPDDGAGSLGRAALVARARRWEDAGFDVLLAADHLEPGDYPPLTPLLLAAEATQHVHVGTLVANNDYHHPVALAREAATLDQLTDGRFELGLGAGHMKREYDALGLRFDRGGVRVDRLGESLEIIDGLLRGETVTLHGRHHRVTDATLGLPPTRRPRLPLLVGGDGPRILALAARHADIVGLCGVAAKPDGSGVAPGGFTAVEVADRLDWLREAAGARFADLELNALVQRVVVTPDRRAAAADLAARWGAEADDLVDSPYLLLGTAGDIAEAIIERWERFGIAYPVVFERDAQAFAPVLERLR